MVLNVDYNKKKKKIKRKKSLKYLPWVYSTFNLCVCVVLDRTCKGFHVFITVFALTRSPGQVKLDLDKWKLWMNLF